MTRDYNQEHKDNAQRLYAYKFDDLMKDYMYRSFAKFGVAGKMLELGCYKGEFTELLLTKHDDVTVIEASSELATYVTKRTQGKAKVINSTFEQANITEKYDAIFLMHTLEHLDDPQPVLKKIKSWLSETGKLFVSCPNANAPSRQIAVKMGLIEHNSAVTPAEKEHGHRCTYTLDTLELELKSAGLNILHRGGIFYKSLANFQLDKALEQQIISNEFMEGCYQLGDVYPDLCASIFCVCE